MKKLLFFTALFSVLSLGSVIDRISAEEGAMTESPMALGFGPELNMNSRKNLAWGMSAAFDYNLPIAIAPFTAGASISVSDNFNSVTVMEPGGMFRWYFGPAAVSYLGFFAQADLGLHLLLDDGDPEVRFMAGLRGGYRFTVMPLIYIEPYARFGYPFMFGFGAVGGVRIKN